MKKGLEKMEKVMSEYLTPSDWLKIGSSQALIGWMPCTKGADWLDAGPLIGRGEAFLNCFLENFLL